VLAHASLITIAVVESGRTSVDVGLPAATSPIEHLQYVNVRDPRSLSATVGKSGLLHVVKKAAKLLVPDLTRLHIAVDASVSSMPNVPDVSFDENYAGIASRPDDFGKIDTQKLVDGSSIYALTHPGANGAYTADVVERTAWPQQDNPRPRYPDALRRAGVEGSFLVEFVVDSTGRVDPKTLSFPKAAHPMFLRAVRDALLHSRYFPAELAGMRVRQLVTQQFTFVIAR
jgi:TonB family protein